MGAKSRIHQLALTGMLALAGIGLARAGETPVPRIPESLRAQTYPLHPDDPAARLDPELLGLPPVPAPVRAERPRIATVPKATREASYDVATGTSTVGDIPTEATPAGPVKGTKPRALLSPGSMGPELRSRQVLGTDERLYIGATTEFPWRVQCKLFIKFPSGSRFIGSGTLVSSRHVLTAGHCVWNTGEGGWASRIEVIPGLDGDYMPFGSAWADRYRSLVGYTDYGDSEYDLALITLDRHIGTATGWFGFGHFPSLTGTTVHIAGYPGDLYDGYYLYYGYGPIAAETERYVEYQIDTASGQSGSGVFLIADGWPFVCAIHAWGTSSSNGGTRITESRYGLILNWIQRDF